MRALLLLACALLAGACGSYEGLFEYAPSPAQASLVDAGADGAAGQVLAAVRGLDTVEDGATERLVFDVRLRIEHGGAGAGWTFDPDQVRLVTGGLVPLELWSAEPPGVSQIAPGTVLETSLAFALPAGSSPSDLELDGLHLSLALDRDGRARTVNVGFERRQPVYVPAVHHHPYPYWWHDPWYTPYSWRPYRVVRPRRRK